MLFASLALVGPAERWAALRHTTTIDVKSQLRAWGSCNIEGSASDDVTVDSKRSAAGNTKLTPADVQIGCDISQMTITDRMWKLPAT